MRLDSSVVQLDVYSNFLLVSTKTRTYICDTVHEQYRQIGKKLRDGHFGACFFIAQKEETTVLKNSKNDGATCVNKDDVKVFCARPGSRLWEANFDSCVLCTHQFRDSMNKNATSIIHLNENTNSSLVVSSTNDNVPCNFNFEKIFMFNGYILTFRNDGIYIFDVTNASLLYWTNYFNNIKDIKILENTIYIWLENNIMKILTLFDIESFVLKLLSRKQYLLCAQFCFDWMDDITALVDQNRLQALKVLNEKVLDETLAQGIEPLLKKVETSKISSHKLENGIYVIDNLHASDNYIRSSDPPIKFRNNAHEMLTNGSSDSSLNTNHEENNYADPCSDKNYLMNILNTQYQLNKINNTVYIPKFLELMQNKSLEELKTLFDLFLEYSQNTNDSQQWITREVLKCLNSKVSEYFKDLPNDSNLFKFIFDCFVFLNKSDDVCNCLYPLSTAAQQTIQYYEIGCEILNRLSDCTALCKVVPSMYRYILEKNCHENILPLLIQYGDIHLFTKYCSKFTYDLWDQAITYLVKVNKNTCLNCDKVYENTVALSWNDFAMCMLCSMGGPTTLKLLTRYSQHIPCGHLDADFYQSCVFVNCVPNSVNDNKTKCINFLKDIRKNEASKTEFELFILKYLKNKETGSCKRMNVTLSSDVHCSVCDISLNSPSFEENVKLKCGHFSHSMCAINRDTCNVCYMNKL